VASVVEPTLLTKKGWFMARLTIGQKGERVLTLLLALRNVRIAAALARHGFTNKDLDEGGMAASSRGNANSARCTRRRDARR
jgi:hypothetical protein